VKLKRKRGLLGRLFAGEYYEAIWGIDRVVAKIHKVTLSSDYTYDDFKRNIGGLKDAGDDSWTMPNYDKKYIRKIKNAYLHICMIPTKRYMPYSYLHIVPNEDISAQGYKELLNDLYDKLPNQTVSRIEYAMDFFCHTPSDVQCLFGALKKCTYIPWGRRSFSKGGDPILGGTDRINFIHYLGSNYKIYERGRDESARKYSSMLQSTRNKNNRKWVLSDTDRVRFEYSAPRVVLDKKFHINSIADFTRNPKFSDAFNGKYNFVEFRNRRLPVFYDGYYRRDQNGYSGAIMTEMLDRKRKEEIINITQYVHDFKPLQGIKDLIDTAIVEFNERWFDS
jgi:hypothetical protein